MRVFVTGASGWIGSAVVLELIAHGHEVVGLARSDASAAAIERAGAEVVRGGIDDLDVLRHAAAASEGVIHLAFQHDIAFSGDFAGAATADRSAIEALGSALEGSGKPFFIASGVMGLTAPGVLATETNGHDIDPAAVGPAARALNAELALSFAERGVRSGAVRLAPTVHGAGDGGFMAAIVGVAKSKRVSAYVGDGSNRWPAVHRSDAARRRTRRRTSGGSAASSGSTRWRRAMPRATCWAGSRPAPPCSRTSTPATTPGRSRRIGPPHPEDSGGGGAALSPARRAGR